MELDQVMGDVLRAARKERGLSQEALALEAGIERNYVSLIERGHNSPSIRMLFKLCKVLKVAPSELLQRAEESIRSAPKKRTSRK